MADIEKSTDAEADEILRGWDNPGAVLRRIQASSTELAAAVMARLASTGSTGEKMNALRDACSILVHQKLNSELIESNKKLDRSATILSWVGVIVGSIIGVAEIVVPLCTRR